MKRFLAPIALVFVLAPILGYAQATATSPPVVIPYGDWIAQVLSWARDLFVAAAGYAVARWAPAVVRQYLTNEVLGRAIDYAIAAIDGLEHGKTANIGSANVALDQAEAYVIANAPNLAKWLGNTLRPKLLARLSASGVVPSNATATKLETVLPPK